MQILVKQNNRKENTVREHWDERDSRYTWVMFHEASYRNGTGRGMRFKMVRKSIDQSITIDLLLLISIDWHRPIDDQSIIILKWSRTSLIPIDF